MLQQDEADEEGSFLHGSEETRSPPPAAVPGRTYGLQYACTLVVCVGLWALHRVRSDSSGAGVIANGPSTAGAQANFFDIGALTVHQLALLVLFCANGFVLFVLASCSVCEANKEPPAAGGKSARIAPLDGSFSQVFLLSRKLALLGVVLFYCYMCEHHPVFAHGRRLEGQWDLFWSLSLLFLGAGLCTIKRSPKPDLPLLHREQTDEWRGWMQFLCVVQRPRCCLSHQPLTLPCALPRLGS